MTMDEKIEVLNYVDFGEKIYGIAKMKYCYLVFRVCCEHVDEFRKTRDHFCEIVPIPEDDATFGTIFPEETKDIFEKYDEIRKKQKENWDDFFSKNKPKIPESLIKLFGGELKINFLGYDLNYSEDKIREGIQLLLKYSLFPYDIDPSKPCRVEFIADEFFAQYEGIYLKYSNNFPVVWIYEYDGNEIRLTPKVIVYE